MWKFNGRPDTDYRSFDKEQTGNSYTFTGTIPVSESSSNLTVVVKAQDKAGNVSERSVSGIKVDLDAPTLTITNPSGTELLNGKSSLTVTGTVEDGSIGSGAAKVSLKINERNFSTPDYSTTSIGADGSFSIEIAASKIASVTGNQANVYLQVEDKTDHKSVQSFMFDRLRRSNRNSRYGCSFGKHNGTNCRNDRREFAFW